MDENIRMPTWMPRLFYGLLIIGGIFFYFGWLLRFGFEHWNDVGVYAITVVLISFGLVGSLVYADVERKEKEKDDEESRGPGRASSRKGQRV